jgi:SRSO17 transposase
LELGVYYDSRIDFSMIHGWSALGGLTMTEWNDELERWLKPFLDRLGHKTRQRMCPLYVSGLIGPGDRKSVQPMTERLATGKKKGERSVGVAAQYASALGKTANCQTLVSLTLARGEVRVKRGAIRCIRQQPIVPRQGDRHAATVPLS